MHHLHLNHLALVVSAIILWLLGAVWYSPALFAKPWMTLLGIVPDKTKQKNAAMMTGMVSSFILDLVLSLVLAHVVYWSGADYLRMGRLYRRPCMAWVLCRPRAAAGDL